jgi:glycosyltransferase involved in cell wall biosynthesis
MDNIFITIGIPVKNEEVNIKALLKNILLQDYNLRCVEIIFVDDGCTDKTVQEINRILSTSIIDYRILTSNEKGLGIAREMILNNANGKYILWIDADIKFNKNFISEQVKYMEENPSVGIGKGKLIFIKQNSLLSILENLSEYVLGITSRKYQKSNYLFGICGSICRTEALRSVGGFDTKIKGAGEDIDLTLKLSRKWRFGKDVSVYYHPPTATWHDLWRRYYWYGYGNHYVNNVHKGSILLLSYVPFLSIALGIRDIIFINQLNGNIFSIFLPIQYFFKNSAWMMGYLRSHFDGYGHMTLSK